MKKLSQVKRLIKESIKELRLNENLVCSTEIVTCECTGGLPSQGNNTCSGTKTNYCNGGHSTDCMCCGGDSVIGTGGGQVYKRKN